MDGVAAVDSEVEEEVLGLEMDDDDDDNDDGGGAVAAASVPTLRLFDRTPAPPINAAAAAAAEDVEGVSLSIVVVASDVSRGDVRGTFDDDEDEDIEEEAVEVVVGEDDGIGTHRADPVATSTNALMTLRGMASPPPPLLLLLLPPPPLRAPAVAPAAPEEVATSPVSQVEKRTKTARRGEVWSSG